MQFNSERKVNPLDVEEMEHSKKAIIKAVQGRSFHDELLSLTSSRREVKKSSSITKLDPILVDRVIRVGGRLHNFPIKQEAKHPVILPKDHHISGLIIRHYHLISGHSGVEHTLSMSKLSKERTEILWPIVGHHVSNTMTCKMALGCFDH